MSLKLNFIIFLSSFTSFISASDYYLLKDLEEISKLEQLINNHQYLKCPGQDLDVVKCEEFLDKKCQEMYEPNNPLNPGNLNLTYDNKDDNQIRFGLVKNNLSNQEFAILQNKIKNQKKFPEPFLSYLNKKKYFKNKKSLPEEN